jgi:RES domain-containing protein
MIVYRIAKNQYADDLSGEGAKLFGGRWNEKGRAVLYTSLSSSLCVLELLVHTDSKFLKMDYEIISIELNDDLTILNYEVHDLPSNWHDYPAPISVTKIGAKWLNEAKYPLLKVPSVVNSLEYNVLINPELVEGNQIKIIDKAPYTFDQRFYVSRW